MNIIVHNFVKMYKKLYKGKDSKLFRNTDIYQTAQSQYPDYPYIEIKMGFFLPRSKILLSEFCVHRM